MSIYATLRLGLSAAQSQAVTAEYANNIHLSRFANPSVLRWSDPEYGAGRVAKVEVLGGYAYVRADSSHGRVNLNGWSVVLKRNLNRTLALLGDFDGVYGSQLGEDISAYSALFGPKFTAQRKRLAPFAHTLFGAVREAEGGDVHYGFGVTLGGGLDVDINRRMAFRLAQTDYEYIRVDTLNHHNFRFVAGVILKFGELK